jgi:H+/gluconate symporter-like permease
MGSASAPEVIDKQPQITPPNRHASLSKLLYAGAFVALVGVVIVFYLVQSHKHQLEAEQQKIAALQAENARLQETPDYQYRQAVVCRTKAIWLKHEKLF